MERQMTEIEHERDPLDEAAIVDEFRAVFGADVKLTWAREGGREVGKRLEETNYRVITGTDLILQPKKAKP